MATTKKSSPKKTAPKKVPTAKAKPVTPKKTAAPAAGVLTPISPLSGTAPQSATAKPAIVTAPEAVLVGPSMRKKEIIDQVVARSGLKKRDVKPVIDHVLAVMGEALAEGRELVAPPFGRIKVHKVKDANKKKIFFAKVHQSTAPASSGPQDAG